MEEQKYINQTICGDADSFEFLVNRYAVGLIIHCEQLVLSRSDAEDVAQEAFIKAYKNLHKFDDSKSRFSTWLYKIATNLALDHLRKNKNIVTVEEIEMFAATTEPTILKQEERDAVRVAVAKLTPPEYRQVIEDYFWRGMSYEQIAAKLNKPVNTIGTYIRRAKQKLREELSWTR